MPTDEELASSGFTREDFETDPVELWPENERPMALFSQLSTQWRVGMSGPTGLDYNVLFVLMGRLHLGDTEFAQLFEDIRFIESAALTLMNQKD